MWSDKCNLSMLQQDCCVWILACFLNMSLLMFNHSDYVLCNINKLKIPNVVVMRLCCHGHVNLPLHSGGNSFKCGLQELGVKPGMSLSRVEWSTLELFPPWSHYDPWQPCYAGFRHQFQFVYTCPLPLRSYCPMASEVYSNPRGLPSSPLQSLVSPGCDPPRVSQCVGCSARVSTGYLSPSYSPRLLVHSECLLSTTL